MTEDKEAENTQSKGDWSDEFVHHWKYYLVPARASPSDLEFIKKKILEKYLKSKKIGYIVVEEIEELVGEIEKRFKEGRKEEEERKKKWGSE